MSTESAIRTTTDANCIFCKIVAGQIPCHRLFEDGDAIAFLDIAPLADGHALLVPKAHAGRLEDLPPDVVGAVTASLGRVAAAVMKAVGAPGYNVLQNNGAVAGQVVPHVHFHIIPRSANDGLGFRWNAQQRAPEQLAALRSKIGEI
ncbi:MAG: HIT family protein [Phycisphaerales bacterium]|nr:HIT family protein [Phycisphaerales bacterium]